MGLYYQAVLSSLLLNFLPDLPRTFFFTPQYPILFFFTLAFTFSLSFFHITADFQQVKRKKIYSFALSGQCPFFFFFHTKVPIFCEDCRPELTEAYHNSKDGDVNTDDLMTQEKWQPFISIAGALTVVSNSLYGAWHAHTPLTPLHPHWTSPKITTNTLIHPFIFHPLACHLLCLTRVCIFCGMLVRVPCNCLTLNLGLICIMFQRINTDPGWLVWSSDFCGWNHDTWTKPDHRSVILWKYHMGSGFECAWACWPSVVCLSFAWHHRSTPFVQLSVFNLLSNSDDFGLHIVLCVEIPPPPFVLHVCK